MIQMDANFYYAEKENGKRVKLPKDKIDAYKIKYGINLEDAVVMYMDDNNIEEDKELTKEDIKSGKYKVEHQAEEKKPRKVREAKISVEKQELFNSLYEYLKGVCDVEIITPNKLFCLKKGDLQFKLDLSQTRVKKGE